MSILLLAEHNNKTLSEQTAKALSAAHALGGDVDIIVCGKGAKDVAAAAAKLSGVRKVLLCEADYLEHQLAEPLAATLVAQMAHYDVLMAAATSTGKSALPRVAALLDVMQISDIIEVVSADTFKRLVYAGSAVETVQTSEAKKVMTVRTSSFSVAAPFSVAATGGSASVEAVSPAADPGLSRYVGEELAKNERAELTEAKIIISGGRGFGSAESFSSLIMPLADKLNAAVGASRAAVDAGFAPNDWQVGQTGKIVAPELYIAIGISGAIQHLAGMKDSRVIVAVNKDGEAPIMQIADYALTGDLFDIVPELTKAL